MGTAASQMPRDDELIEIVRKFGALESVITSDAVTAEGERVSCTELRVRLKEGANFEELLILLKMNGFPIESFSKRGLKAKIVIGR